MYCQDSDQMQNRRRTSLLTARARQAAYLRGMASLKARPRTHVKCVVSQMMFLPVTVPAVSLILPSHTLRSENPV